MSSFSWCFGSFLFPFPSVIRLGFWDLGMVGLNATLPRIVGHRFTIQRRDDSPLSRLKLLLSPVVSKKPTTLVLPCGLPSISGTANIRRRFGMVVGYYYHALGKRRGYGTERLAYNPHNTTYVVLGTCFLWFGWFGFNGGSALGGTLRAAMASFVTNVS